MLQIDKTFIAEATHLNLTVSGRTDFIVDHNFNQYPDLIIVYREKNGIFYSDRNTL